MKVVGLCGGSGSGKGVVSQILKDKCIPVIDTDAIYHELTNADTDCLRELKREFGDGIIRNGVLHRPSLARIVFSSEDSEKKRTRLNSITHGYVLSEVRGRIADLKARGYELCVIDVPLLFESGFDKECDLTVAVIAERDVRINRIILRDNISRESAILRIDSQISNDELINRTDMQIFNNSDITALNISVSDLLNKIREKFERI